MVPHEQLSRWSRKKPEQYDERHVPCVQDRNLYPQHQLLRCRHISFTSKGITEQRGVQRQFGQIVTQEIQLPDRVQHTTVNMPAPSLPARPVFIHVSTSRGRGNSWYGPPALQ